MAEKKPTFEVDTEITFFPDKPAEEYAWQEPEYITVRIPIICIEQASMDYWGEWDGPKYDLDFDNMIIEDEVYGDATDDLPFQFEGVIGNDDTQKKIYAALVDPEREK